MTWLHRLLEGLRWTLGTQEVLADLASGTA